MSRAKHRYFKVLAIKVPVWGSLCLCFFGLTLLWLSAAIPSALAVPDRSSPAGHYLLLVSHMKVSLFTSERLTEFDKSPYDGVAIAPLGPYDVTPVPSVAEIVSQINEIKRSTKKDLWPWVNLKRMIGRDPDSDSKYGQDPYFFRIKGADLENKTGAQDDFIHIWENSLGAAKEVHAPGITVDLEYYSNYKAYDPYLLAKQMGKSPEETMGLLKKLGARMADTAAKEYPDAILWFLFTDLGQLGDPIVNGVPHYPSPAYIVLGLLDQIHAKHYDLKVIDGAEVGLDYCSFNLKHLLFKIRERDEAFAPHVEKYKENLQLAGTMILYKDKVSTTDFMTSGICSKCEAATVEDLQPYLETLLKTYRYNWIYASYYAGYDPFHPRSAPRFNAMIRKAEANAHWGSAN